MRENYRRAQLPGDALFGDARAPPFADGSFDGLLSGGLFYADIVPRKVSLYRWAERGRMARDEHLAEGIYESDLSRSAWRDRVRAAGFRDVRIASAGVYPPYTFRDHERFVWKYGGLLRALDGTPIADLLGFFYMVTARK